MVSFIPILNIWLSYKITNVEEMFYEINNWTTWTSYDTKRTTISICIFEDKFRTNIILTNFHLGSRVAFKKLLI